MTNRDIVIRLRPYTSTLTWAQLKSLTKQAVIDDFQATADPFTADELIELGIYGRHAFRFLKNEWAQDQHEDFIENRYLPAFKAAINPSLSSYTVRQVYEYTISQGLSDVTAQMVHKKAVNTYREVLNG